MAKLTTEARKKLDSDVFALPDRRYPIPDEAHARNALARVSQHGTTDEIAKVKAKVRNKFPGIDVDGTHPSDETLSLPDPSDNDSQEDFVGRFMGDDYAQDDFPEQKQRLAVAYQKWRDKRGIEPKKMMICLGLTEGQGYRADASDIAGLPTEIMGQPVEYWWKDVLQPGTYMKKGWPMALAATPELIQQLKGTGDGMLDANVPIPINTDHSDAARDAMGNILRFKMKDSRLMALHQLVGKDAVAIAARNKVSPTIDPDFIDGKGRHWGEAIVSVSLTPRPVVPDQNGFVKAASLASGASVLMLSLADEPPIRRSNMADMDMPCSLATMGRFEHHVKGLSQVPMPDKAEHIAKNLDDVHGGLKKLSGMGDDYNHTAAMSLIEGKMKGGGMKSLSAVVANKARKLLSLAPETTEESLPEVIADRAMSLASEISTKDQQISKLAEEAKKKDEKILEMSQAMPQDQPPALAAQYCAAWKRFCDGYMREAKVTQPEVAAFESLFGVKANKVPGLALSAVEGGDQLMFAVFKWAMSLSGVAPAIQRGLERDPNYKPLDVQQMADSKELTREEWRKCGINNPPEHWLKPVGK